MSDPIVINDDMLMSSVFGIEIEHKGKIYYIYHTGNLDPSKFVAKEGEGEGSSLNVATGNFSNKVNTKDLDVSGKAVINQLEVTKDSLFKGPVVMNQTLEVKGTSKFNGIRNDGQFNQNGKILVTENSAYFNSTPSYTVSIGVPNTGINYTTDNKVQYMKDGALVFDFANVYHSGNLNLNDYVSKLNDNTITANCTFGTGKNITMGTNGSITLSTSSNLTGNGNNTYVNFSVNSSNSGIVFYRTGADQGIYFPNNSGQPHIGLYKTSDTLNIGNRSIGSNIQFRGTCKFDGNVVGVSSGNISGFGRVYNGVYNDYAELFETNKKTEPGDILALDIDSEEENYKLAVKGDIPVGVHSDSFAMLIGGEYTNGDLLEHNKAKFSPVGMSGRVYVKVKGPVDKGDFIALSDIPGVGIPIRKDHISFNTVVGVAVETKDIDKDKIHRIRMFIKNI